MCLGVKFDTFLRTTFFNRTPLMAASANFIQIVLTHFTPKFYFYNPLKRHRFSVFRGYGNGTLARNELK